MAETTGQSLAMLRAPKIIPGLDFTDEEIADARKHNFILSMDLEITSACNGRCVYCYRYDTPGPQKKSPDELTTSEIKALIEDGHDNHGLKRLCILGGEPFLPQIRDKYLATMGVCNQHDIRHVTFSNGLCLTECLADQLREARASICLKLNGMKRETHDFLVNQPGAFGRVMKSFEMLQARGYGNADDDCLLAFETVVTTANFDEIEDMWKWARDRGIVPYVEKLTIQGRSRVNQSLAVDNSRLESLFRRLNQIDRETYGFDWEVTPPIAGYHCSRWYISLTVCETGKVKPCVGVEFYLGDIRHQNLEDILTSPLTKITRNVDKFIKGRCRQCELRNRCYGCRGAAYQTFGDFTAEDPNCWRKELST